jgi:Asp/Glu/hydantoin racemase
VRDLVERFADGADANVVTVLDGDGVEEVGHALEVQSLEVRIVAGEVEQARMKDRLTAVVTTCEKPSNPIESHAVVFGLDSQCRPRRSTGVY